MFIKNAWYVAAWGHEVTAEVPFGRTILTEPVVLYRTKEGKVAAVEDRCCHRIYPLSKGRMNEGRIQCGYHGMIFDETGACVDVPWQKNVPKKAKVRAYPVVEQAHWIWIWMGDPALANPDEITDFHWLDDPDWGAKGTVFHVKCDYKLIVENLLDLTHLAYVHQTTIGNDAVAEGAETKYDRTEEDVTVTRWVIDAPAPPTYVKAGGFDKNVDRWQIINFTPPSSIRLDVGACDTGTGAPEGKRVGGINMRNLNGITRRKPILPPIISGPRRIILMSIIRMLPNWSTNRSTLLFQRILKSSKSNRLSLIESLRHHGSISAAMSGVWRQWKLLISSLLKKTNPWQRSRNSICA